MAELLARLLRRRNFQTDVAFSVDQAHQTLRSRPYSIVLCDINLGAASGLEIMAFAKSLPQLPLFVFITGDANVETAISAIREGAFDYLSKPGDLDQLERQLLLTMERAAKRLAADTREPMRRPTEKNLRRELVGSSPPMADVYRALAKAALFEGNVLVLGETGTGKEIIARAIHQNSRRAKEPFVVVNCGALTETLLESELFGHVRGSFTGATANKTGLLELASGGTLFLDEIGDISPGLQVKLLRAIQEGEIRPVGSVETRHVDVRVVAATHRNLEEEVRAGRFREDLYYRLKVFLIDVPPLRHRLEDLEELVEHFIAKTSIKAGKATSGVSKGVIELLKTHSWPGNVRELENAVSRAVAGAQSDVLFPEDFPPEFFSGSEPQVIQDPIGEVAAGGNPPTLAELERDYIIKILKKVRYKKAKAAELLGIDRVTLYRKVSRYGITDLLSSK